MLRQAPLCPEGPMGGEGGYEGEEVRGVSKKWQFSCDESRLLIHTNLKNRCRPL